MSLQKIARALISVSDKSGIVELASFLQSLDIELISTGGSARLLKDSGLKVKDISDFTGFPEIMDGRVKTLHPKVHGALLGVPDNKAHQRQAKESGIGAIDLVIVNLYPFKETVAAGKTYEEIVEKIDIGGPSMVRSTAKNHAYKTVITDINDYEDLISELKGNSGSTTLEFRKKMAGKAFHLTADYDTAISLWFSSRADSQTNSQKNSHSELHEAQSHYQQYPKQINIITNLKQNLRYGENPHQTAALYSNASNEGLIAAKQLQGKELSYNNLNDADAAFNLVAEFTQPATAIIKHTNPCGAAIGSDAFESYIKALESDSKSAYGGIVAINREVDSNLAQEISKMFYEVVIATKFSNEARELLSKKKNLRLLESEFIKEKTQIKSISGGFLMQEIDNHAASKSDLEIVSKTKPSDQQIEEMLFAFSICKHVKSNAILITDNFQITGIGAGQTSRVDAVQIACQKAQNFTNSKGETQDRAKNAILASDAFFPFADGIEFAGAHGIKCIIAPKGSIRDQEVIEAADKNDIALAFTNTRHFKH